MCAIKRRGAIFAGLNKVCGSGTEKEFQQQVAAYLKGKGIYFETDWMHKATSGRLGRPDFRMCIKGRFCAMECKTKSGKLTVDQYQCLQDIEKSGGKATVVRCMAEVMEFVQNQEAL